MPKVRQLRLGLLVALCILAALIGLAFFWGVTRAQATKEKAPAQITESGHRTVLRGSISTIDRNTLTLQSPRGTSVVVLGPRTRVREAKVRRQRDFLEEGQHVAVIAKTGPQGVLRAHLVVVIPPGP